VHGGKLVTEKPSPTTGLSNWARCRPTFKALDGQNMGDGDGCLWATYG